MAEVRESAEFGAAPDEIWKVVGDFDGMFDALAIPLEIKIEGDGVGRLRTVSLGRSTVAERLEALDEQNWTISYSIVRRGHLPLADYFSTIQLSPLEGGRCRLAWTSAFEPVEASAAEAEDTVRNVHGPILAALEGRFGA